MNFLGAMAAIVVLHLPLEAATLRASFLMDQAAWRNTLDVLRDDRCAPDAIRTFQRAVERYAATEFVFDFSKFPKPHGGFYSFESASALVKALPHPLCETRHPYEFNCFDAVIALAGDGLHTSLRPDDIADPFLVLHSLTNGSSTILPRATAKDAFDLAYPAWYRDMTDRVLPVARHDARIALTALLFRCHPLPQSTTEEGLSEGVMRTLRAAWKRHNLQFPTNCEVVLCHQAGFSQRTVITAHAGLLFPHQHGYVYIEKGGGGGPFVRLDVDDKAALLVWLSAIFWDAERQGYTHCFATFNDTRIEKLECLKR